MWLKICAFTEYKLTGKKGECLTPQFHRIVVSDFTIYTTKVFLATSIAYIYK
jgi:hypothetical protein